MTVVARFVQFMDSDQVERVRIAGARARAESPYDSEYAWDELSTALVGRLVELGDVDQALAVLGRIRYSRYRARALARIGVSVPRIRLVDWAEAVVTYLSGSSLQAERVRVWVRSSARWPELTADLRWEILDVAFGRPRFSDRNDFLVDLLGLSALVFSDAELLERLRTSDLFR